MKKIKQLKNKVKISLPFIDAAKLYEYNDNLIEVLDCSYEKIGIEFKVNSNMLYLSNKDDEISKLYEYLLDNDYLLYFHKAKISYFIKREKVSEIWKRSDLLEYKHLFYQLQPIDESLAIANSPVLLLVIFSGLPNGRFKFSANIAKRTMTNAIPFIDKMLIGNVVTVNIMDLNRTYGSAFGSTSNHPNMESEVTNLIKNIIREYNLDRNKVILYGSDKGAVAAEHYSKILGTNLVCVNSVGKDAQKYSNYFVTDIVNTFEKDNQIMQYYIEQSTESTIASSAQVIEFPQIDSSDYHLFNKKTERYQVYYINKIIENIKKG